MFGGTCGVRTDAYWYLPAVGSVFRSVQYCQPALTSCRYRTMTASGVLDMYQTPRSYWWPGVTHGAHDVFSVVSTVRAPLVRLEIVTWIALPPSCALLVVPIEYVLLPEPYLPKQSGKLPGPVWLRPELTTRLTPALADVLATTTRGSARVAAPIAACIGLSLRHFLGS